MKKIIFFCGLLLLTTLCNRLDNNSPELIIELPKEPTTAEDFSKFIKELTIIPLETNKNCLIGRINKFRVVENRIYIQDYDNKSLLVFNLNGKFLFKIYRVGKGPGEYLVLRDFLIDKLNQKIFILGSPDKVMEFTSEGKFIDENRIKIAPLRFGRLNNGSFYVWTGSMHYEKNNFSVYRTNKNLKIRESYFPYKGTRQITSPNMFTKYDNSLYFRPFPYTENNTIYSLSTTGIYPKYLIDFGKKNWPKNANPKQIRVLKDQGFCYNVDDFFETRSFISWNFAIEGILHRAMYSKKTGNAMWWKSDIGKSLTGAIVSKIIIGAEYDCYYAIIEPYLLKKYKPNYTKYDLNHNLSGVQYYSEFVYKIINNLRVTDNPVIFKVKF